MISLFVWGVSVGNCLGSGSDYYLHIGFSSNVDVVTINIFFCSNTLLKLCSQRMKLSSFSISLFMIWNFYRNTLLMFQFLIYSISALLRTSLKFCCLLETSYGLRLPTYLTCIHQIGVCIKIWLAQDHATLNIPYVVDEFFGFSFANSVTWKKFKGNKHFLLSCSCHFNNFFIQFFLVLYLVKSYWHFICCILKSLWYNLLYYICYSDLMGRTMLLHFIFGLGRLCVDSIFHGLKITWIAICLLCKHSINLFDTLNHQLLVTGKLSCEGKVGHKFDMEPHSDNLVNYGKLCRERTQKSMIKNRKLMVGVFMILYMPY